MARVNLDWDVIRSDPQIARLLEAAAADLADLAERKTRARLHATAGPVEQDRDGPVVTVGARAAGAVSVEVGTRYRSASRPFKRAADELGIEVGS